jgi:mycobactin lysine-N-oxygenase
MSKKIAVVGGGPKAAAICAKVDCLRRAGGVRIEVSVFEKSKWGAAWSGVHGYTDGRQRLCTPAERDVGFPYQAGLLTAEQTADLHARYSWAAYLVSKAGSDRSLLDWVNRGRRPPTHAEYASYIGWVIESASVERKLLEVTSIERSGDKWTLRTNSPANRTARHPGFDGVVVSGPGTPLSGFARPDDLHITDGAAFWLDPHGFLTRGRKATIPS